VNVQEDDVHDLVEEALEVGRREEGAAHLGKNGEDVARSRQAVDVACGQGALLLHPPRGELALDLVHRADDRPLRDAGVLARGDHHLLAHLGFEAERVHAERDDVAGAQDGLLDGDLVDARPVPGALVHDLPALRRLEELGVAPGDGVVREDDVVVDHPADGDVVLQEDELPRFPVVRVDEPVHGPCPRREYSTHPAGLSRDPRHERPKGTLTTKITKCTKHTEKNILPFWGRP